MTMFCKLACKISVLFGSKMKSNASLHLDLNLTCKKNLIALCFCNALAGDFFAVAQIPPSPIAFPSQDSLIRIYYTPHIRWTDSILQVIQRHVVGHNGEKVYQNLKQMQQKLDYASTLPVIPYSVHSAVFLYEPKQEPRRKKRWSRKKR